MNKIPLTQGYEALVDDFDYQFLQKYKWHVVFKRKHGKPYAQTTIHISGSGKSRVKMNIMMHKLLVNTKNHVDHIDGNTLNNQRFNLRSATNTENHQNIGKFNRSTTSKYKGVSKRKNSKLWRATIKVQGKQLELGFFASELDAAKAYNNAAIKYFMSFAKLNDL